MSNTRGNGLLETWLSKLRASKANSLISTTHRQGRILDIGCGSVPYFLKTINFAEKYGLDPEVALQTDNSINISQTAFVGSNLPFENNWFDVVTLLAVVEHLELSELQLLFTEIFRVLKPGGRVIITTPAVWTNFILWSLAKLRLLSPEEIAEHKDLISSKQLKSFAVSAGFKITDIKAGYFELGLNQYFYADK